MEEVGRALLARAKLSPEAMDAALDIAGLRPNRREWRRFATLTMALAGVLSLAAGMVFLVAFNWQNLGTYGRFAMVEISLLAAVITAWSKGMERLGGKLALTLAVLLTGAFLALFGQTYQTGADVYELFLGWAVLALPWVIACRYAPCWAIWLVIVNAAAALYAISPGRSWLGRLFGDTWQWTPWTLACLVDLLAYLSIVSLSRWKGLDLSETWLRRGVMAIAMMFGTFAMIYRIAGIGSRDMGGAAIALEVLLFLAATAIFAAHAWSGKEDLFNFAVIALAWIVVSTGWLIRSMFENEGGPGAMLIVAIYVIGSSTGAVKGIAHLSRQWKMQEVAR